MSYSSISLSLIILAIMLLHACAKTHHSETLLSTPPKQHTSKQHTPKQTSKTSKQTSKTPKRDSPIILRGTNYEAIPVIIPPPPKPEEFND
jgi:uncharacterized protein YdeI (BOF family)